MNRSFRQSKTACHLWRTVQPWWLAVISLCLLTACQPIVAPTVAPTPADVATATPAPTATPTSFTYGVTVLDAENRPVPDAHILIEIEGQAPLDEYADANGYARIVVPATHAERPGRLTVNARGYEIAISNIDLYQERLPDTVRLTTKVVGNTTGFCPDNLTFATGFAGAKADETLVVVSNFADTNAADPRNLTFDLIEKMQTTLADHAKIRIERLNCAIKQQDGSDTAMRIGSRQDVDASIVIWGVYVEPPDPEVRIYFDIVKQQETYLGTGFDRNFGPQLIQPSMFDFKATLGEQVGEVVAFAAGLVLFNAHEHLAAEPLFTTAIAAADQPLATEFGRAIRYYRGTNYLYLGRALEAKTDLVAIIPPTVPTDLAGDALYLFLLNSVGYLYFALGEQAQALDYYNQALLLSRSVGDRTGEARTLNNIGGVYNAMGDKQQALDYYTQALPLRRSVGDKAGEAATLNNIGLVYDDLSDRPQALNYYNQALPLSRTVGNKAGEAATLNNLGLVYAALGDQPQALDFYNQALPLMRQVGDKVGEATTLTNIGAVYAALGDQPQALGYYNQALPLMRQVGDKVGEATTLTNIGAVYAALGDKPQALDYYNQALPLRRQVGDKAGEATTLNNIGLVYADLGDKQQALDYYNQALPMHREVGNKAMEAATLNNIGGIYYTLGDKQQALDYFNQALPLSRAVGDKVGKATTLTNIGSIYLAEGNLEEALKYVTESVDILHEVGALWIEVTGRGNIAFLYLQLGDLDAATESLKTAIILATELNHPNLPALQALLAEINAQRGE